MSEVLLVPTGAANLASVQAAFQRLGIPSRIAASASELNSAAYVVLPGVGSFEAGMGGLQQGGFVEPLRQRIEEGKKTLAICLGFQLLGEASDESPGVAGLGIWPLTVRRLPPSPLLPQMGWNRVSVVGTGLLENGQAYYANSYAFFERPQGWKAASSWYGRKFVAAVERGGVLACQFHPELSGSWGEQLLRRWLADEKVDCYGWHGTTTTNQLHSHIHESRANLEQGTTTTNQLQSPLDESRANQEHGTTTTNQLHSHLDESLANQEHGTTTTNQVRSPLDESRANQEHRTTATPLPGAVDTSLDEPRPCRVIPCLDVQGGRVVKGVRFQNLRDAGDPSEQARRYAAEGADELVMLDVSATLEEREASVSTVKGVRSALNIPLTVGGGVRSEHDAARLLEAGADKVGVNSAAVESPDLISRLADRFGRQCVVIAVDAARSSATPSGYEVVTRSGSHRTGLDAVAWCAEAVARGAGEILLTSWDQDGTRSGYELSLISQVAQMVKVPLIASGGASRPEDLVKAVGAGADGVLAASIFHDRDMTVGSLKQAIQELGVAVR